MNFVIEGPRGIGKTKQLADYIYNHNLDNSFLVCANTTKMIEKLYTWGYKEVKVISYKDFLELDFSAKIDHEYYIDNLNEFLTYLKIDGYTYTWKNNEIPEDTKRN